jgi:hypothetical protein
VAGVAAWSAAHDGAAAAADRVERFGASAGASTRAAAAS